MKNRPAIWLVIPILIIGVGYFAKNNFKSNEANNPESLTDKIASPKETNPLMIEIMGQKNYQGSDLKIEQTLSDGENYHQYIASYYSDNLKIYGLLTVPTDAKPKNGWPVIIFNHGYVPPEQYRTTERYVSYVDAFARNGYIVFKPDYRGNGSSEGQPEGAYYSPAYATDVLNAASSLKREGTDVALRQVYTGRGRSAQDLTSRIINPEKFGMWGHSMGGNITLRNLVVDSRDIKAAVIWGGVVGTYDDLMNNWQRKVFYSPSPRELALRNRNRQNLIQKYGAPAQNPKFWQSIDPNFHLSNINTPIQLHAGLSDEGVPWQFSQGLDNRLKQAGKTVELYTYEGDNHNISNSFNLAISRSIEFFDKYLK